MKVRRLGRSGFCFGVRRASDLAAELLARGTCAMSLGPLMHNPQEVARLAGLGLTPREQLSECGRGPLLLRTHGVDRAELETARRLGIELADATCPHVLRARRELVRFGREGRSVWLVGDARHPEVRAQASYAEGPVLVVASAAELPALSADTRLGVLAQTTAAREVFEGVVAAARAVFADVAVSETLCDDAALRQAEAAALARTVDAVLVVGGFNSANTRRLFEVCRAVQPRCAWVETVGELLPEDLQGARSVGLVAGASTPDWVIDQVTGWLERQPG